jgi:hypothetical protein
MLLWIIEGIFIEGIVTAGVATPRLIARSTASIRTISFLVTPGLQVRETAYSATRADNTSFLGHLTGS